MTQIKHIRNNSQLLNITCYICANKITETFGELNIGGRFVYICEDCFDSVDLWDEENE